MCAQQSFRLQNEGFKIPRTWMKMDRASIFWRQVNLRLDRASYRRVPFFSPLEPSSHRWPDHLRPCRQVRHQLRDVTQYNVKE